MTISMDDEPDLPGCAPQEHPAPSRSGGAPTEETFERAVGLFRAAAVGARMSTVSQQLRLLGEEDLLVSRRAGKHVWYALADRHVESLLQNVPEHADPNYHDPSDATQDKEQHAMTTTHEAHGGHAHVHSEHCGHTRVRHDGHYDEHVLEVSAANPADHNLTTCLCGHDDCGHDDCGHDDCGHDDCGHERTRHGDHCDDHGPITVAA